MIATDDFTSTPATVNNVTGGNTPSVLDNDAQVAPVNERIVIVDQDGSGAMVATDKKSIYIPRDTPIGMYAVQYKIVNVVNGLESNIATANIEVVSRTTDYSREYPTNALDIVRAGNNGDFNRVFINPQQDTNVPSVYESLVLEGYTGTKSTEIIALATAMKPLLDRGADVVEALIATNAPNTTQTASRSHIERIQIDLVL